MPSRLDFDDLARNLALGLQRWLAGKPAERPLRSVTDALAAERDRAAEAVAERYRTRTDALRDVLSERRAALDAADDRDATPELARRARVLEQARDLGRTATQPAEQPAEVPEPRSGLDVLQQVRAQRGGGRSAGGGKKAAPPVRDIPGVGPTLGTRLEEAGITDARAVAGLPPERLADVLQVSLKRAGQIAENARRLR